MRFPIETNIVGLFKNSDTSTGYIYGNGKRYVIPEYQRDYSWSENEIESFVLSLKRAMNGESVFMGTIQYNMIADSKELHIIDGQQRMTTFLLLCNILEKITGDDIVAKNNMKLDIKNFGSNNGKLNEALALEYEEIDSVNAQNNHYIENTKLLKNELAELKKSLAEETEQGVEYNDFETLVLNSIIDKIYFVELTTKNMKLPEVVGIFNTINTTGLDLNCSDLFKLQYYEYLKENYSDNNWMSKICDVYEIVNKLENRNMGAALDIYKHCIVAKHGLGWAMLSKSNESFFEEILNDKKYNNSEILQFEEFKKIIEIYLKLSEEKYKIQSESAFAEDIIWGTRYGRYWTMPYVIAYFITKDYTDPLDAALIKDYTDALEAALIIAKYFVVCSVNYDKVINPVQTFICNEILPLINSNVPIEGNIRSVIKDNIQRVIKETPYEKDRKNHTNWNKLEFVERIKKDLYANAKRARIVCTLSALLEETNAKKEISEIREKLFDWEHFRYDIEHIYAKKNFEANDPQNSSWYNGIGNLVVLNQSINRDFKDALIEKKVEVYEKSPKYLNKNEFKFVSVEKVAESIHEAGEKWGIEQVRKRADEETKKLCDFLGLND